MSSIPIFDSLTHPTRTGGWISSKNSKDNTVQDLLASMEANNIQGALAVGMGPNVGGYVEDDYAPFIYSQTDNLFPVAFVDFATLESGTLIREYLRKLRRLGYVGIKIHPRLSRITLSNELLPILIKEANQSGLSVLLCTYFWDKDRISLKNTPEKLHELLCEVPNEKLILLHGGGVRLLEIAELVRHFQNTLLDLSFTMCKYEGSSIDLDIKYLFEKFDRRICIGSDSPEFNQDTLRMRFEHFSNELDEIKKHNIAYLNIRNHITVDL